MICENIHLSVEHLSCFFMLFLQNRPICCHILKQIRNRIPLGLELAAVKRDPACRHGPDAYRVVHVIIGKSGFLDFLHGQIPGQLVHDG